MERTLIRAHDAAEYIKNRIGNDAEIAIVLGSGLGTLVDEIECLQEIEYKDIPNFPLSTVPGHAGKLVYGTLGGRKVLVMKGRFHYYEGYEIADVVFHIRVFKLLGIKNLLVTNAAGGINRSFKPGDLMSITDHISFFAPSSLRGKNLDSLGVRFPDMSQAYNIHLREIAKKAAGKIGFEMREGVYVFCQGPMYETPAEIRALALMGADAVGMSTVPEVIAAKHADMNVLGISCITNMASGILPQPLNHEEVMSTAKDVEHKFKALVKEIVENWII